MENKGSDNKKLTKILFVTGFSLLILFIVVRLIFKSQGDRITDMPVVGELTYNPKKVEQQSKVEQFEAQRTEKQRKEMGLDEDKYVVPNFNDFTKNDNSPEVSQAVSINENNSYPRPLNSEYANVSSVAEPSSPVYSQEKAITPNSKLKYHSNYFSSGKEEPEQIEPSAPPIVPKNPFGTISTENNYSGQKETSLAVAYYTAEIYGDQKIEDGQAVLIRNTQAIQYPSFTIPKNSILYGQASFHANRVLIKINRAKTSNGEFAISFSVNDNDRLDGIYYKAPIDETIDKTKEDIELPTIPGGYGNLINTVAKSAVKSGKELMKKTATLNLEEGYKIFIVPFKQN